MTGGPSNVAWGNVDGATARQDGPDDGWRVEPYGNDAVNLSGSYQYYTGGLQGFGIYAFPFSPGQALAHALAAETAYSTSATATLHLVEKLPVQPTTGDSIILYPGCDLTYPTYACTKSSTLPGSGFVAFRRFLTPNNQSDLDYARLDPYGSH